MSHYEDAPGPITQTEELYSSWQQNVLQAHAAATLRELTLQSSETEIPELYIKADSVHVLPELADERGADTFFTGQILLMLHDERLVYATVKTARPYQSAITLGPPESLSNDQFNHRANLLKMRVQDDTANNRDYAGLLPDPETLRIKMAMRPEFQRTALNPSPGYLHLTYKEGDPGIITDMHHNYIITFEEWTFIAQSDVYREAWLSTGSVESLRVKSKLETAINKRIEEQTRR